MENKTISQPTPEQLAGAMYLILKGKVGGKYYKRVQGANGKWKYYYSEAEYKKATKNKRKKVKKDILKQRQTSDIDAFHSHRGTLDDLDRAKGKMSKLSKKESDKRRTDKSLKSIKQEKKEAKKETVTSKKEAARLADVAKLKSAKAAYAHNKKGVAYDTKTGHAFDYSRTATQKDTEKSKKGLQKVLASHKKKYGKVMVKSFFQRMMDKLGDGLQILKGKKLPIGHTTTRKDGSKWTKQKEGKWVPAKGGKGGGKVGNAKGSKQPSPRYEGQFISDSSRVLSPTPTSSNFMEWNKWLKKEASTEASTLGDNKLAKIMRNFPDDLDHNHIVAMNKYLFGRDKGPTKKQLINTPTNEGKTKKQKAFKGDKFDHLDEIADKLHRQGTEIDFIHDDPLTAKLSDKEMDVLYEKYAHVWDQGLKKLVADGQKLRTANEFPNGFDMGKLPQGKVTPTKNKKKKQSLVVMLNGMSDAEIIAADPETLLGKADKDVTDWFREKWNERISSALENESMEDKKKRAQKQVAEDAEKKAKKLAIKDAKATVKKALPDTFHDEETGKTWKRDEGGHWSEDTTGKASKKRVNKSSLFDAMARIQIQTQQLNEAMLRVQL